jgi:hypothetical protein
MFDLENVQAENTGWKPLRAGLDVPAKLEEVGLYVNKEGEKTENLVFKFVGTEAGNTGSFDFMVWANTFDPEHEYFSEDKAERTKAQIKHILNAYLPEETTNKIKGSSWTEFAENVGKALNGEVIARPCFLKVILDSKDRNTFPTFPDFIRTDLTPDRSFSLGTKINPNTGLAYERIEKMDQSQGGAPNSNGFGTDAPAPSFMNDDLDKDTPAFG